MGDRPGCFSAERPAPPLPPEDAGKGCGALICERVGSPRKPRQSTGSPAGQTQRMVSDWVLCWPGRLWSMAMSFLSAFRDSPPYRWYFLQSMIGTLNPFGTFIFYWCALI